MAIRSLAMFVDQLHQRLQIECQNLHVRQGVNVNIHLVFQEAGAVIND